MASGTLPAARPVGFTVTIGLVVIVAAIILGAEAYVALRFLGRAFARVEPWQFS